jgi:hypothetical protein
MMENFPREAGKDRGGEGRSFTLSRLRYVAIAGVVAAAVLRCYAPKEPESAAPERGGRSPAADGRPAVEGTALSLRASAFVGEPLSKRADYRRRALSGTPYEPDKYSTRRIRVAEDYELWELDAREAAWLLANEREVLTRDLETVAEPSGGLRIAKVRAGSLAACRGLQPGDLLRDINGMELDGPFGIEDFLEDPSYRRASGWRLTLQRDSSTLMLDYRPGF